MANNSLLFGKAKFNNEDMVMFDTSVLVHYLGLNNKETTHNECRNLVNSISKANAMIVLTDKSFSELTNISVTSAFKAKANTRNENDIKKLRESDLTLYNDIVENALNCVEQYKKQIFNIPAIYNEALSLNPNSHDQVMQIMRKYQIHGIFDAEQVVIALQQGVQYFATTDCDFNSIKESELQVLVDSNTYYK